MTMTNDDDKWAKFDALATRRKVLAFLFNLTAFPVMSDAARLQAATLSVIATAILFGAFALCERFCKPAPQPPVKIMNGPL